MPLNGTTCSVKGPITLENINPKVREAQYAVRYVSIHQLMVLSLYTFIGAWLMYTSHNSSN
jgi:hypothetical protein